MIMMKMMRPTVTQETTFNRKTILYICGNGKLDKTAGRWDA